MSGNMKNEMCQKQKQMNVGCVKTLLLMCFFSCVSTLGMRAEEWVCSESVPGAFPLVTEKEVAALCYDDGEYAGVVRAIGDLQKDICRVTGRSPRVTMDDGAQLPVIIGTVGRSKRVTELLDSGLLHAEDLEGKWESFVVAVVEKPSANVPRALVIAGSDKRGTIYGIYELSRQLGVSPWYWWADVPVCHRDAAYVKSGYRASGEPKVKYRGIFINDEFPCMTAWAREKFGGMNSKMYAHVYELLLRLKANTLWPAMWGSFKEYKPLVPELRDADGLYAGNCFNEDDPENPRLADEYGIVIGTSHHEPMQRSQQEWMRHKQDYGNGEWNWLTNKGAIKRFFSEGIENTKDYESLVTIGMRGDEDRPMTDAGSREANFRVMEEIIAEQRRIIRRAAGRPAREVPQVWTLYSEVLDYYDGGLEVPDDVIIMLCDDNFGHVRRLPDLGKERHPGGYGMYYHVGYYGAPRASKWLTMSALPEMWEQLQATYDYGVDRLWMLNVGDIKPHEYAIDFFMEMAWNPERFRADNLQAYAEAFCARQFGPEQAREAAELLSAYGRYVSRVTAEMLDAETYNLESGEFKAVRDEFMALEARALRQFLTLPGEYRDAYQELVLFPIQGMANLYDMYYAQAMNRKLAEEKNPEANRWADRVEECFERDSLLCHDYNHRLAGGKWNHMMDQVHIGYAEWHAPRYNRMPEVVRVEVERQGDGLSSLRKGHVFRQYRGVVAMEAEHVFDCTDATEARWNIIPGLGRSRSGLALMPYTVGTDGARAVYRMELDTEADSVDVWLTFAVTMPFLPGGHYATFSLDGSAAQRIGLNQDLIWENKYTLMYPTAASRVIRKRVRLPLGQATQGSHVLEYRPLQPGIVLEQITVDCGGYEETRNGMPESPYAIRP